jgi:hypothetical protein
MTPQAPPPLLHEVAEKCTIIIKAVDQKAREIERKWGIGRLQNLVPAEWSERFLSQQRKFSLAAFEMNLDDLRIHAAGMERAFDKLEEIAISHGHIPNHSQQWEFQLSNGSLVILVRDRAEMAQVDTQGRQAQIWAIDEIIEIIDKFPTLSAAKDSFPGAEVQSIRPSPDAIKTAKQILEDEIPF